MIYKDKSKEEVDAALEQHFEAFEDKIGFKPSEIELLEWTKERLKQRVLEARESSFGHFSPKSLEILIKAIQERMKPAPIVVQETKPKKKGKSYE